MSDRHSFHGKTKPVDYIVRAPRIGDAIGQSLKRVYTTGSLPRDMQELLGKLDRVAY
jgi:hypothetical protein